MTVAEIWQWVEPVGVAGGILFLCVDGPWILRRWGRAIREGVTSPPNDGENP
jgi:hypothetical protein